MSTPVQSARRTRTWFIASAVAVGVILGSTTLKPFLDGFSDALAGREPRTSIAVATAPHAH